MRPSLLTPSTRPTLLPSARTTVFPRIAGSVLTEPPTTQRCATVHPRFESVARHEVANLLAVMRMNVDFLESVLAENPSTVAASALEDIQHAIQHLESRFAGTRLFR